jgi:hypothetical protein
MKAIPTVAQKSLLTALLLTLLSACTVYYGSPLEPATRAVITRFVPDRGEGAVYRRGQAISFTLSSQRDGYLSLLVIDPDGSRYAIARNLPVRAGSNRLSGPTRTTRFAVVPPARTAGGTAPGPRLLQRPAAAWARRRLRLRRRAGPGSLRLRRRRDVLRLEPALGSSVPGERASRAMIKGNAELSLSWTARYSPTDASATPEPSGFTLH